MSTFGALKAQIADETLRPDLALQIGFAIRTAIRCHQAERFWFNEASASTGTSPGDAVVSPPADLIGIDLLELEAAGRREALRPLDPERFAAASAGGGSGRPAVWTGHRDRILLHPVPDAAYTLWLSYVRALPPLEQDGDGNAWTAEAADLIRERAKAELYASVIDDPRRAQQCATNERLALAALRRRSLRRLAPGGRIRATAF